EQAQKENRSKEELIRLAKADLAIAGAGNSATEDPIIKLQIDLAMYMEEYGPNHPKVKQLQSLINNTQLRTVSKFDESMSKEPLVAYLNTLKTDLDLTTVREKAYADMYQKDLVAVNSKKDVEAKLDQLRAEIELKRSLYAAVVKKVDEANFLKS